MSKMCAWASMSEAGTTEGTPGDQTGSEVKRGEWYQFGQDEVFRWKNDALGRMAAALAGGIANNDHVGYGQSDRLTFFYAWRAVGYDISRVTSDVNVDCSAFICAIVNACGIPCDPSGTTYNMASVLGATGQFDRYTGSSWTDSDTLLRAGDIVCNSQRHVIMVTDDVEPAIGPVDPSGYGVTPVGIFQIFLKKKRQIV